MRPCPDRRVLAWFDSVPVSSLYVSFFTVGEIRHGILRLPASKRRDLLAQSLDEFVLRPFADRFIAWDLSTAETWAKIYADGEAIGRCPSLQDSIIAATALSHGMTMVTRNEEDFQFDGLSIVNPFEV